MKNVKRMHQFILLFCGLCGFLLLKAVPPSPRLLQCCEIKTNGTQATDLRWQELACQELGNNICQFPKTYPGGPRY